MKLDTIAVDTADTPVTAAPALPKLTAPAYAIQSVDNVLRLLLILRRDGGLRVSVAAAELGVARSTAHRLISMLRFRGFIEQAPDRSYVATAGLGREPRDLGDPVVSSLALAGIAHPHLTRLADRVDESVVLCVRRGNKVEFIDSIEATQCLHVGCRIGARYSAWTTAVGAVLLADLPFHTVRDLYAEHAVAGGANRAVEQATAPAELPSTLSSARRLGYAVVSGTGQRGVTALARPLYGSAGRAIAAVSIAAPVTRYKKQDILVLLPALTRAIEDIRTDILELAVPGLRKVFTSRRTR